MNLMCSRTRFTVTRRLRVHPCSACRTCWASVSCRVSVASSSWCSTSLIGRPNTDTSIVYSPKRSTGSSSSATTRTCCAWPSRRSEEHTSELQSLMRISYAVFCLKKKKNATHTLELIIGNQHHYAIDREENG